MDFLPHIEKLNRGEPNYLGEICFGGEAVCKNIRFLMKISVKPNQFLYVQVSLPKNKVDKLNPAVEYYVATLNHLLMKDIEWN